MVNGDDAGPAWEEAIFHLSLIICHWWIQLEGQQTMNGCLNVFSFTLRLQPGVKAIFKDLNR
jgi:hypothetical protein